MQRVAGAEQTLHSSGGNTGPRNRFITTNKALHTEWQLWQHVCLHLCPRLPVDRALISPLNHNVCRNSTTLASLCPLSLPPFLPLSLSLEGGEPLDVTLDGGLKVLPNRKVPIQSNGLPELPCRLELLGSVEGAVVCSAPGVFRMFYLFSLGVFSFYSSPISGLPPA